MAGRRPGWLPGGDEENGDAAMRTRHDGPRRRWPGRWRLGRGWVVALVLVVAGPAVTVAGTVAVTAVPASAGITVPVVSAGGGGSCAAEPDLTVWCWGANFYGELGVGTTSQGIKDPVVVPGLQASQVSAGDQFTCAVTLAHTAECWGDNNFGELGNGTFTDSSKPVKVKGLSNVTAVAAGYFHACALESNGTVWCWGDNGNGELGDGTTTASNKPVLASVENVTAVAAGNSDTCAIASGGSLLCWGLNSTGQLGTGNFTDQSLPAQVTGLSSGVQQVGLGLDFGCALADRPTPQVLCWGDNGGNGTLGNGSFSHPASTPVPSRVFGLQVPPSGGPGGPQQIAVGTRHACVVMTTGLVQCWGQGGSGRLGDGSTLDRDIPAPVLGLPLPAGSANAVTAGIETGCGITKNLEAACWGKWVGDGGSLAAIHTSAVPVQAAVSQVSAGWGGFALVHKGGLSTEVRCWGTDKTGQLQRAGDGPGPAVQPGPDSRRARTHLRAAQERDRPVLGPEQQRAARRRLDQRQPHAGRGDQPVRGGPDRGGRRAHLRAHQRGQRRLLG
jgi:alpha-tubulin suppressor-like RCC1 family protein